VFVQHVPNVPSGGQSVNIELADFLGRSGNSPEQQALVRLIGALVKDASTQAELLDQPSRPAAGAQGPFSPTD
jgi:hypothetical protein